MDQNQEQALSGALQNLDYLESLYENKEGMNKEWKRFFDSIDKGPAIKALPATECVDLLHKELKVMQLITAYRTFGHLAAKVNPIDTHPDKEIKQLSISHLGFSESDLEKEFPTCGLLDRETAPLKEIIDWLKSTYSQKIGIEYMGTENLELEEWIQKTIEPSRFQISLSLEDKKLLFDRLNHSELFEKFLHTKFVGQKRFSLEGCETLIPIISTVIDSLADSGADAFVIGMAHRGRLNVLSNILSKARRDIFSEFEDRWLPNTIQGSGDVKYHKGFGSEILTRNKKKVSITLTPNPSHLESVDPVVEGQVRAEQDNSAEGREDKIIPILVHGDAALAGQGVVYETLQMCALEGYKTGGTVHIIINNQIGFTTLPKEGRSTQYCSDIAKAFGSPVFHVNAEDPEACMYAAEIASLIRHTFHIDVFIDINCYRKYGHNESDEPAFTQPLEYKLIRSKKSIREIYRDDLIAQGILEKEAALKLEEEFHRLLQEEMDTRPEPPKKSPGTLYRESFDASREEMLKAVNTAVDENAVKEIAENLAKVPENFNIHPKLLAHLEERLAMVGLKQPVKNLDWGMAEALALGTLLDQGINIRFAGQDTCRGTFSHRHAVFIDQKNSSTYVPLQHISPKQGKFKIYNSFLSEYAALGFEYGYSIAADNTLVLWEAQFGDFANGGQVIIDQYIATAEQKWDQQSNITLLLPHGYEGQGPEHSSGRIERFLQLAAENNMYIVNPTTPAQIFHLLRRQALRKKEKPLVVFTPKGLLRHPLCTSVLAEIVEGAFQEVLDDPLPPEKTDRLVFTSGRIYNDLIEERKKAGSTHMAIIRIEQLYPLHAGKIRDLIEKYKGFKEAVFFQEEPSNMGPADYIIPRLRTLLPDNIPLSLIARNRSAATATGSHTLHKKQHQEMMKALFTEKPTIFDVARNTGK